MNIGIIRSSNLCAEVIEYTDTSSVATCNLSSVSLPSFVKDGKYNFSELGRIVKIAVKNLNNVIDRTYYPVVEAETNNLAYRPIGLGIQGLSDVFSMFKLPWGSENATKLNRLISEVMYYYALEASHEFAIENEKVYSAFEGSPVSKGILQYDMWGISPLTNEGVEIFGETLKLDWEGLKEKCKKGVANSLLIALMPTATSSQILGNNECFEPVTSNIYTRSTNSGDYIIVNKHLAKDLKSVGLWTKDIVNKIIENNGSIQSIDEIPREIKEVYKTVWEISQKIIIDYAADRAPFVDQTQSMNIFINQPSYAKLSSMHLYGWKKGLKTGSYYIRSKPSSNAVKFTILKEKKVEGKKYVKDGKEYVCNDDVCVACSS
jgi:ribonucleoside-diphosphate reductase alpha subunit